MKNYSLFFAIIFSLPSWVCSQSFTLEPPPPPFDQVYDGAVAFADINGDDKEDVFIGGPSIFGSLYLNDGFGNFSKLFGTAILPSMKGGQRNLRT